jgi:dihydrofolate reductase
MAQTVAGAARPRVSIIAAVARNRVIGRDNAMPWHIPGELARFRELTMGHPIIMGRRTHQSIGRPLPGRRNIVISRDPAFVAAGCEVVSSLQAALTACSGAPEVFVIGGAQIYAAALALADRLLLTEIQADFDGDTRFPDFDRASWRELARQRQHAPAGFDYDFVTYARAAAADRITPS